MNKTLIVADEIADDVQSEKINQYIVKSDDEFIKCKYVFLKSTSGKDLGRSRVRRIARIEIHETGILLNNENLTYRHVRELAINSGFESFNDMLDELKIYKPLPFIGKLVIWTEIRKNK